MEKVGLDPFSLLFPAVQPREIVDKQGTGHVPWPALVDGSFSPLDGSAAAGMVLRDHGGLVQFAAYRVLFNCNDAWETEIHALIQGMTLFLQHSELQIIVQWDSS